MLAFKAVLSISRRFIFKGDLLSNLQSAIKPKRVISVFTLAMLNVSVMASLRNLPLAAEYGLSLIFYFVTVALLFLVPSALVSAELATGWSKSGGIYVWVREAFGDTWGFFAIWMQWVHNVTWYPAILAFVATTLGMIFYPEIAHNKYFVLGFVLFGFWAMTFLNFLGIKTSSKFSTIGVISGTIIPGIFLIILGFIWFTTGKSSHITFSFKNMLPDFSSLDHLVFLGGLLLAFAGLEVSSGYASEVKDPQKNYPKSIVLAALITFFLFMLGALAVALVIPKHDISLVSGLMDAIKIFLNKYHIAPLLSVIGVLLAFGSVAEVNSWIIGPVKALYATTIHGNLPPIFKYTNSRGVPVNILLFQAIIVSISSLVFLNMPSLSTAYWILSALSAQTYLVMYTIMFIAALKLRYSHPHVPRLYRIPYKHKGIWIVCSIGIITCISTICLVFIPPSQLPTGSFLFYELFLSIGLVSMSAIPLIIHIFKSPQWAIQS